MAEPLRGAAYRLHPARVSESRPRPWRTTPAPHPGSLLRVLPPGAYSPLARSTRMRPTAGELSGRNSAESCRFGKSVASTIATSDGPLDPAEPVRNVQSRPSARLHAAPPPNAPHRSVVPDAPAGRPSCLQSPGVLGLSRERRPSSTEWDEVSAKDRISALYLFFDKLP
jgi:hypothetical protein